MFGRLRRRATLPTRTKEWEQVGLGGEIDRREARRARGYTLVLALLLAATLVGFSQRTTLFPGAGKEVKIATVVLLVIFGWTLARELSKGMGPALMRRLEPGTAGSVGFLVRLMTGVAVLIVALRIAGLSADQLLLGGAFTAIVVGLAAQQTIGNVFAGLIIVLSRPFRVGQRVRVLAGALAGSVEGTVSSVGLLHVSLVTSTGRVMIPNSLLMQVGIEPIDEPARVDVRAKFGPEVTPAAVQGWLEEALSVPLRYPADITLEELDSDSVTVRIRAVPRDPDDGGALTTEVLRGVRRGAGTAAVEKTAEQSVAPDLRVSA
jgi:small-conductance mechanosensitive channel